MQVPEAVLFLAYPPTGASPSLADHPCRPCSRLWPSGVPCSLQPGLATPAAVGSPAGTPRGLPNDPARGGNIWQRCEELEDAAREMQAQKDALLHERMQAVAVSIFMHPWDRADAGLAPGSPLVIAEVPGRGTRPAAIAHAGHGRHTHFRPGAGPAAWLAARDYTGLGAAEELGP